MAKKPDAVETAAEQLRVRDDLLRLWQSPQPPTHEIVIGQQPKLDPGKETPQVSEKSAEPSSPKTTSPNSIEKKRKQLLNNHREALKKRASFRAKLKEIAQKWGYKPDSQTTTESTQARLEAFPRKISKAFDRKDEAKPTSLSPSGFFGNLWNKMTSYVSNLFSWGKARENGADSIPRRTSTKSEQSPIIANTGMTPYPQPTHGKLPTNPLLTTNQQEQGSGRGSN